MREDLLYEIVKSFVSIEVVNSVKPKYGTHLPLVHVKAQEGPAASGVWSRPDVSMIHAWRHKYLPNVSVDMYGFEVKGDGRCDLRAVHETLAHRRFVHFAYLVWQFNKPDYDSNVFSDVLESCESYGLGLVTFSGPVERPNFKTHLTATRGNPKPSEVDDFIETRFPKQQRSRLVDWLGGRH